MTSRVRSLSRVGFALISPIPTEQSTDYDPQAFYNLVLPLSPSLPAAHPLSYTLPISSQHNTYLFLQVCLVTQLPRPPSFPSAGRSPRRALPPRSSMLVCVQVPPRPPGAARPGRRMFGASAAQGAQGAARAKLGGYSQAYGTVCLSALGCLPLLPGPRA